METRAIIFFVVLITVFVLVMLSCRKKIKELCDELDDAYDCNERLIAGDPANIDLYQLKAQETNKYEPGFEKRVCCALGLASEAGEVAGKVDKCIRKNHNTDFTDEQKKDIALEIGDVMWFAAGLAHDLGYSMSDILKMNIDKLTSRNKRNVICGSGDHR